MLSYGFLLKILRSRHDSKTKRAQISKFIRLCLRLVLNLNLMLVLLKYNPFDYFIVPKSLVFYVTD
ncbi:MAG: hypothetical protein ACI8X3_001505 [Saprospiraceae bacterium]|jgi:hypothetical protein